MGTFPNWPFGYVPTPAQWEQWFGSKQDDLNLSQLSLIALQGGANSPNGFPALDGSGLISRALLKIATGTFTLNENETTTTVSVQGATASSVFAGPPVPLTQNAAHDAPWSSYAMEDGQFVVTHANNSLTDRTFSYCIFL